ncbi:MAG: 3-phenylpropionate/cinnamic acid dioxygenase subunit beta [Gammaproteobacteria bacterium]|nr:3-phenylpropionate/cinnamic acid dioxygenase subunit beta [Gammaproteobacteria bacterium]
MNSAEVTKSVRRVELPLHHEVEQFLYAEARLLDNRQFIEWLSLISEDVVYFAPTRYNVMSKEPDDEFSSGEDLAIFDESKSSLSRRVKKIQTGRAWSEEPMSRTRRLVTNITATQSEQGEPLEVTSNFLVYRNHLERTVEIFAGSRTDSIVQEDSDLGFEIKRREIIFDQSTILAKHISILF